MRERVLQTGLVRWGWSQPAAAALVLGLAVWLCYPLLWPMSVASGGQHSRESVIVIALTWMVVALLGIALWRDARRDYFPLAAAISVEAANVLVRHFLNAGSGVEFNYALVFIAGAAGGGPVGVFVGAASCLVSQLMMNYVAVPLPGQVLAWALPGLVGALVRPFRPVLAWVLLQASAVAYGVVAGILLNLTGWPFTDSESAYSFFEALPLHINASRLLAFSRETSFGIDLTRGITSATAIALIGLPLIRLLRRWWRPDLNQPQRPPAPAVSDAAIQRRTLTSRFDAMWRKDNP